MIRSATEPFSSFGLRNQQKIPLFKDVNTTKQSKAAKKENWFHVFVEKKKKAN